MTSTNAGVGGISRSGLGLRSSRGSSASEDPKHGGDLAPSLAGRGDRILAQQFAWVSRAIQTKSNPPNAGTEQLICLTSANGGR